MNFVGQACRYKKATPGLSTTTMLKCLCEHRAKQFLIGAPSSRNQGCCLANSHVRSPSESVRKLAPEKLDTEPWHIYPVPTDPLTRLLFCFWNRITPHLTGNVFPSQLQIWFTKKLLFSVGENACDEPSVLSSQGKDPWWKREGKFVCITLTSSTISFIQSSCGSHRSPPSHSAPSLSRVWAVNSRFVMDWSVTTLKRFGPIRTCVSDMACSPRSLSANQMCSHLLLHTELKFRFSSPVNMLPWPQAWEATAIPEKCGEHALDMPEWPCQFLCNEILERCVTMKGTCGATLVRVSWQNQIYKAFEKTSRVKQTRRRKLHRKSFPQTGNETEIFVSTRNTTQCNNVEQPYLGMSWSAGLGIGSHSALRGVSRGIRGTGRSPAKQIQ